MEAFVNTSDIKVRNFTDIKKDKFDDENVETVTSKEQVKDFVHFQVNDCTFVPHTIYL